MSTWQIFDPVQVHLIRAEEAISVLESSGYEGTARELRDYVNASKVEIERLRKELAEQKAIVAAVKAAVGW